MYDSDSKETIEWLVVVVVVLSSKWQVLPRWYTAITMISYKYKYFD